MDNSNKKYSAIILSTSYGEDEQLLIEYLVSLEICKSLKKQFSVLPVLVFEKIEKKRKYL